MNGVFEPTDEMRRQCTVYRKQDASNMSYLSMTRVGWMVQSTVDKEADESITGFLRCSPAGALKKSPLDVPADSWMISTAVGWKHEDTAATLEERRFANTNPWIYLLVRR